MQLGGFKVESNLYPDWQVFRQELEPELLYRKYPRLQSIQRLYTVHILQLVTVLVHTISQS